MSGTSQQHRLPPGAVIDEKLLTFINGYPEKLNLGGLNHRLNQIRMHREYDAARLLAGRVFMDNVEHALKTEKRFWTITSFVSQHLPLDQRLQIARRFLWDREAQRKKWARRILKEAGALHEEAAAVTGQRGRIFRHPTGRSVQEDAGLLPIATVGELRATLGIATPKQLGWMLLSCEDGPYRSFTIPKSSGQPRRIDAPLPQLRAVQRRILKGILSRMPVHEAAHGFVKGCSTVTNAAEHVGKRLLVKFDLKDFFPTISYWRVVGLFAHLGYDVGQLRLSVDDDSRNVAPVLARLCCFAQDPEEFGGGYTPQGAPTSPAISNLILRGLDARLAGIVRSLDGVYTRYADDLTFSFHGEGEVGRLRWWVEEICRQEGFAVNQDKFRVIRASQRQQVTGVVVNDCLRVPRQERRRFRAILHNCQKHGVASQARGRADMAGYLRGYASYINMVHPEEGRELLAAVDALLGGEAA
ncbi:MAG: RNA-directed DNA polymerase [Myxococcota bacterium]|jgi:RNA-directed DNA polymerase